MINAWRETKKKFTRGVLIGFCSFGLWLSTPEYSYSTELDLLSLSFRTRVSDDTVLGNDAPEFFTESDIAANFKLPWQSDTSLGWSWGTRLMTSIGVLRGANKNALTVSAIPELTFGSEDGRYILDLGIGGAIFSRYKFGVQDFGGHFQFALTVGGSVPLNESQGIGYRFLHYSDAGGYGPHTTGADFHMIEFIHRF